MKANELRIGNYVKDRGGKILTIDYFERDKIYMSMGDYETGLGFKSELHPLTEEIKYLEPIPLTEEWLLKFGFIIRNIRVSMNYGGEAQRFAFLEKPDFVLYFYGRNGFGINAGYKPKDYTINYVHELQNLYFALTGEELEVLEKV